MQSKRIALAYIFSIGIFILSNSASAEYRFSQKGFDGGGMISGTFDGIDTTGTDGIGVPDGKITYCSGSRGCNQPAYDNASISTIKFSGNSVFSKLNIYELSEVVFTYDTVNNILQLFEATDTTACGLACLYYSSDFGQVDLFANEIFDWHTSQPIVVIPPNQSWVQGTAASLELPTTVKMNVAGWGALLTIPASPSGAGAWVHIPLAIPAIESGVRTILSQVQVKYAGTAIIDQVDVWDGKKKIASNAVHWSEWDGESTMNNGVNLYPKARIYHGVNVSLHVKNDCPDGETCLKQTIEIISVGGTF